jgi:hypothetical protein
MNSRFAVRDLARQAGWGISAQGPHDLFRYVGGSRGVTAVQVRWTDDGDRIITVYHDGVRKTGGRPMLESLLQDHM